MNVTLLAPAEEELEDAFDHYERERKGLGLELLYEFRRGVDQILQHPHAWQPLDPVYRRCRVHRFPFGIVYRLSPDADQVVIAAFMHLSRTPRSWPHE